MSPVSEKEKIFIYPAPFIEIHPSGAETFSHDVHTPSLNGQDPLKSGLDLGPLRPQSPAMIN